MTLALTGSPHDETEPKKATYVQAVAILMTDFARDSIPPCTEANNGKSKGFWRLNWLRLKGQNNQKDGTNKNEFKVCE